MPREYRHIKEYEKELHELKLKGFTLKEIGDAFGFSREQGKRKKSLQSCNSTVTKAFNIHRKHILT